MRGRQSKDIMIYRIIVMFCWIVSPLPSLAFHVCSELCRCRLQTLHGELLVASELTVEGEVTGGVGGKDPGCHLVLLTDHLASTDWLVLSIQPMEGGRGLCLCLGGNN